MEATNATMAEAEVVKGELVTIHGTWPRNCPCAKTDNSACLAAAHSAPDGLEEADTGFLLDLS